MTIAQVYKILERQERVSIRLNFFLFSVCYMERVRCLVISTKTLFLQIGKTLHFIRVRICTTLTLALL